MNHGTRSPLQSVSTDTLRNCVHTNVGWSPRNGQTAGRRLAESPPARGVRQGRNGQDNSCRRARACTRIRRWARLADGGLGAPRNRAAVRHPPLPYEERLVAVAPDGGEVLRWQSIPRPRFEYLEMFYNMRRAGTALRKLGAVDFDHHRPGVRDVLLTGKAIEAVKRGERAGKPTYDAIVMDAPPTGRITRFLNVTSEVGGSPKLDPSSRSRTRSWASSVLPAQQSTW